MALVLKDRVKVTSTTTGTGTLTLAGAATGYQSFAAIGDGNTTYYAITDPATGDWEVGLGTYTSSGTTLSRTTILSSSNAGSVVDLQAGTKEVFCVYPAEKAVYEDASNKVVQNSFVDLGVTGTATINVATLTSGTVATTPASNTDIANKQYVDTMTAAGIHYHSPVRVESPTALTATYNNGTAGVGATLTNAGTQVALVIDGVTVSVNDRVLIYTQADATQNGIYTVTNVGSGSTNWVLTRATDADTFENASPDGLSQGSTVFVQQGATGAGETYTCNTVGTITFGTTNITFAQISSAQIYSAGTGLTLSGTQFSITNTGTAGTYGSATAVPVFTTNAQGQVTAATNTNIAINANQVTAGTLAVERGGTNIGSYTTGDLIYASGTTTLATLADAATGNVLLSGGAGVAPSYGKVVFGTHTSGTNSVSQGGTGATTLTGYVYGNGTSAMTASTTIPNSATTATSANTASAIVARDASGNFSAGTVTAALSGNATTATTLQTARNINGTSFNGSADITVTANTTNTLTRGTYLTGSNFNGSAATTWAVDADTANTASKVVVRDGSGNFAAGTITATLSGNATNVTGTVAIANGGTGQTTRQNAMDALAGAVTSGQYLRGNGTDVVMSAIQAADVPTLNQNTTGSSGSCTGNAATATTATTATTANALNTANNYQVNSLGVGTAGSGTAGEIRATNNITAYYSDERLKTKIGSIENALEKVKSIETMVYHANETAVDLGYDASVIEVGVTAQSVQKVMPQTVAPAPIDDKYLTVRYERLVPLLIEAIKELEAQVAELKAK